MKRAIFISVVLFLSYLYLNGQAPANITVRNIKPKAAYKTEIDRFYLNHVVYSNGFLISNIYGEVSLEEMIYITNEITKNLKMTRNLQFSIKTDQDIPYRLVVMNMENPNNKEEGLIFLTNYNPESGKFEKEIQGNFYAKLCPLNEDKVTGGIFSLSMDDEKKYINKEDYISLIQLYLFSGLADDKMKMDDLFLKAEQQKDGDKNMVCWLKSYYNLYLRDFDKAEKELFTLKENIKVLPEKKQTEWKYSMNILEFEINLLKATFSENKSKKTNT